MSSSSLSGTGRLIIGLLLIVLGVLLLLGRIFDIDLFSLAWPFFIIIPGVIMLAIAVSGDEHARWLSIPGSIVTAVGLLLFIQQALDVWASWAYAWALISPGAVGFGIWLNGRLGRNEKQQRDGIRVMEIGAGIFAAGFIFFEMILNLNDLFSRVAGAIVGGMLLIVVGGLLIYWSTNRTRGRSGA